MTENETSQGPLTPAQWRAIDLLVGGSSFADACRELDCAPITLWRWRHQVPAFAAELQARLGAIREAARDRLMASTDKAVTALVATLDSPNDAARVAAARALFDRVGLEAPPATTVVVPPSEAQQAQLSDVELKRRVRRMIFGEFVGMTREQMIERVSAVLNGEED